MAKVEDFASLSTQITSDLEEHSQSSNLQYFNTTIIQGMHDHNIISLL